MTFELRGNDGNCAGCEWISAEGEIEADTYLRPIAFAGQYGARRVYLNSPGGSLIGGLMLGETLRSLGMNTNVASTVPLPPYWDQPAPGVCVSACAFAFLGGVERHIEPGSYVGVHQFYNEAALLAPNERLFTAIDVSNNQVVTGLVLEYVSRMGADAQLVALASRTLPSEMYILSEAEAFALRVAWDPAAFMPWQIEPYGDGIVAFSKSYDETLTLTLYCAGTRKALLLSESAFDAEDQGMRPRFFRDAIEAADALDVLGAVAGTSRIRVDVDGTTTRVTFSLPADFVAGADVEISNFAYAPHSSWFGVTANGQGLAVAGALAFRNCIS